MSGNRRSTLTWLAAGCLIVALCALADRAAAAELTVIDLGTLGGNSSEASGINNSAQVVGWSTDADGAAHAFLYADGGMTDLGLLPGGSFSAATAINDSGAVVGYAGINEYGPMFREFTQGFMWRDGAMESLGALFCPCSFNVRYGTSAAYAINDVGQVAGDSLTGRATRPPHSFLWQNGLMEDIGGGPGSLSASHAYGINASGQVVGSFDGRAAVFQNGGTEDLGTLPGHTFSTARAINAVGQVVGESGVAGADIRAFLWDGHMRDLGTLPGDPSSSAIAINAAGQVVGWSGTPDGVNSRAVLWQDGVILDLNSALAGDSGWTLTKASGINDRGQIVGIGLHNGETRAFLMSLAPAVGSATIWVGLSNSDAVGLRVDLRAEVFVNGTKVGEGQLDNVSAGSSGFSGALRHTIPLTLTAGIGAAPPEAVVQLVVSVRRTCSGGGHNSGTPRLWFDGDAVDSGAGRDAGSRMDANVGGDSRYFLRSAFALSRTSGSSRTFVDKPVDGKLACPDRPFTPFGSWSITPP